MNFWLFLIILYKTTKINLNDSYIKYLKKFMDDDVMIFGCDVNKPSPTDKNHRGSAEEMTESVAAVICL